MECGMNQRQDSRWYLRPEFEASVRIDRIVMFR